MQAMVGEPLAAVRCVALRCLGKVLEGVDSLPPSDAKIFNECDPTSPIWLSNTAEPVPNLPLKLLIITSTPVACVVFRVKRVQSLCHVQ